MNEGVMFNNVTEANFDSNFENLTTDVTTEIFNGTNTTANDGLFWFLNVPTPIVPYTVSTILGLSLIHI